MKSIVLKTLAPAILAVTLSFFAFGSCSAAGSDATAAQNTKNDYSWLLKVEEAQAVTGFTGLQLKSLDSKKSGEANDLTFSTPDGNRVVMVQILRGQDFDMYYSDFRSQDFKAWPDAFWGPPQANPPSMFWFKKNGTLIMISTDIDTSDKPAIEPDMFVDLAKLIRDRIPSQGL